MDSAAAGHSVGYESASQFSREYRRLFGAPPVRDIAMLRARWAVSSPTFRRSSRKGALVRGRFEGALTVLQMRNRSGRRQSWARRNRRHPGARRAQAHHAGTRLRRREWSRSNSARHDALSRGGCAGLCVCWLWALHARRSPPRRRRANHQIHGQMTTDCGPREGSKRKHQSCKRARPFFIQGPLPSRRSAP